MNDVSQVIEDLVDRIEEDYDKRLHDAITRQGRPEDPALIEVRTQWYPFGAPGFPKSGNYGQLVLSFWNNNTKHVMVMPDYEADGSSSIHAKEPFKTVLFQVDDDVFSYKFSEKCDIKRESVAWARKFWVIAQERGFWAWGE